MVYSSESSLMKKFDLQVNQLDYKYIENCSDVKKLEKILKVLRSGEEGVFPDLISFCEKKLFSIDPKNRLLQTVCHITKYNDLSQEERKRIQEDIKEWSESNSYHTDRYREKFISETTRDLPPIREQRAFKKNNSENTSNDLYGMKQKSSKPRSYKEWDKFNVDDELEKLDNDEVPKDKSGNQKSKVSQLSDKVPAEGFTEKEREYVANLENTKGNEAFKAKEYEEAVVYYTRSLSIHRMAKTLNNRAQAYIKLKNYVAAVIDCNEVIGLDPDNVKAYYRRGVAHKEDGMYDLAAIDFHIVLELDPQCKEATEHIQQIPSLVTTKKKKNSKVLIEELDSTTVENEATLVKSASNISDQDISTKIMIEEVTEDSQRPLLDDMCTFSEDRNDIQPLSKRTKDMLMIFNNDKGILSPTTKEGNSKKSTDSQLEIKNGSHQKKAHSSSKRIIVEKNIKPLIKHSATNQNEGNNNTINVHSNTKKIIADDKVVFQEHDASSQTKRNTNKINEPSDFKGSTVDDSITPFVELSVSSQKEKNNVSNSPSCIKENTNLKLTKNKLQDKLSPKREYLCLDNELRQNNSLTGICNQSTQSTEIVSNKSTVKSTAESVKKSKQPVVKNSNSNFQLYRYNVACTDKEETKQMDSKTFSVTPFEFINLWRFKNASCNMETAIEILLSIKPYQLPQILTNKLDGPLLSGIIMAIGNLICKNKLDDSIQYLNYLVKTPRISMISMLLTNDEKKDIGHLFSIIEGEYGHDLIQARKILNIT